MVREKEGGTSAEDASAGVENGTSASCSAADPHSGEVMARCTAMHTSMPVQQSMHKHSLCFTVEHIQRQQKTAAALQQAPNKKMGAGQHPFHITSHVSNKHEQYHVFSNSLYVCR